MGSQTIHGGKIVHEFLSIAIYSDQHALTSRKRMKALYIFYENKRAGFFSRDVNLDSSFSYDERRQNGKNRVPLSRAMALSQQTFNHRITLSIFENLLPEGDVRYVLERDHNIHGSFEFLEL